MQQAEPEKQTRHRPGAECGKLGAGFPLKSSSNLLEPITFYDFGLSQFKVFVI
jgi:hypothetical protein